MSTTAKQKPVLNLCHLVIEYILLVENGRVADVRNGGRTVFFASLAGMILGSAAQMLDFVPRTFWMLSSLGELHSDLTIDNFQAPSGRCSMIWPE
jgi:hypothetical protein